MEETFIAWHLLEVGEGGRTPWGDRGESRFLGETGGELATILLAKDEELAAESCGLEADTGSLGLAGAFAPGLGASPDSAACEGPDAAAGLGK